MGHIRKSKTIAKRLVDAKLDTFNGNLEGVLVQPEVVLQEPTAAKTVSIPELNMRIKLRPGSSVKKFIIRYVANNPFQKKRLYTAYGISEAEEVEVNPTRTIQNSAKGKRKVFKEITNWR